MKKLSRLLSIFLVLCMLLSILPTAFAEDVDDLSNYTFILHSNDVHGAIEGYASIAALRDELKASGADVILADAGDYSQGTTYVSVSKGATAVEMMNATGYDVASLGNHEFDYGYPQLAENMESADFTVLCSDVLGADGNPIFDAYTIIEKGGVKVGFFGLETPETQTKANPALIQGLTFLTDSTNPTIWENAQAQVDALKAEGADVVVCLSHLGVDASSEPYRSYDLYNKVTGIDFIIDAHSHTVMTAGDNGEPIQSTGTKFANIGIIVIDKTTKKIVRNYLQPVGEDGYTPKNDTIAAAAQAIIDEIDALYGSTFATSEVELNGAKAPGNRTEETNNGDLITDAMIWCLTEQYPGSITEVPEENIVAITNGGGIRASISVGDVTKNNILTVLPFGNTLAVVYVTGAELLEALEASTYCVPESVGGFPQVAGMKFTLDTGAPYDANAETYPDSTYYGPASINRVTIDEINGEAFDPEATYAVITNNFCAGGGDTYYAFASASSQFDTGYTLDAVVIDYITEKLGGTITAAQYGETQGRINIVESELTILYTNDIHTYINKDLSYSTIATMKDNYEAGGKNVLLVDAGDHIQGTAYGGLDKGATIMELMASAGYDLATLGNHEFDYGMERALEVCNAAKNGGIPYISCNFYHEENGVIGDRVLESYKIFEIGGKKIAFIGITTPESFTKSTPKYFQDDAGNYIYGISGGEDGAALYADVQTAIDGAKADGADYIIALGHLGVDPSSAPWRSTDVIANTTGLDAFIDGHSHTTVPMQNVEDKDGNTVVLTQTGSYFDAIGKLSIYTDGTIATKLVTDYNGADAATQAIQDAWMTSVDEQLGQKIAESDINFTTNDADGNRAVRKYETNMGNLNADAYYWFLENSGIDVDVAIMNGGGIRASAAAGDWSYLTCKTINTFGNVLCAMEVTGQQIWDALEWGARQTPVAEIGGFLHTSGLTYEVDGNIVSTVQMDDKGVWTGGPTGEYRVKNVKIYNKDTASYEPIDVSATYILAGTNYTLRDLGDGFAMFNGATLVIDYVSEDYLAMAAYVSAFTDTDDNGYGNIASANSPLAAHENFLINYESATGAGRITVTEAVTEWDGVITIGGLEPNLWTTKYGNIYTDASAENVFEDLGFNYGDIITVKFLDQELDLPLVSNFSDVDSGTPALFVAKNELGNPTGYAYLAINMGNFTDTYGIATKKTDESGNWYWEAKEGVEFPIILTFELKEAGGYMAEYLLHQLQRTNDREDYADLTDEEFANFRNVTTSGMGYGILYRSSSPINPELGRNTYADAAIEAAGVKTIINLADNADSAAAYEGFEDTYYSKQNVIYLNLGVDFFDDSFKAGLANGLRHFANNEGPYMVHCTEGKDRAGFISALLECFMGATYEEVVADYMVTYYNYYGVEVGTEQYDAIAASNIIKTLTRAFEVEDLSTADLAAEAREYIFSLGLNGDEVNQLYCNLMTSRFELVADSSNMFKYGHLDLNVSTEDFLKYFSYGDIVTVSFNGQSYDFPVCSNYDDVDTFEYLIRAATGKNVVTLAINYGQIGVESGIIEVAPEGSETKYQLKEGVTFPIIATVTMKEAGGYADELSIRQLNRTNNREDYPELTDEQFANFRKVTTSGVADGILYRSSSPINPELGRNTYADAAAAAAGVKTFINLADTEEEATAYEGYAESYYSAQNHIFLGLPVAFTSDTFKNGLAEGYRYMTVNEGPYLIHCTEGKDRAGLTTAILECFMGASVEEITADYVTTFRNYYNVVDGVQTALTETQEEYLANAILKNLCLIFDMEDATTADLAAEARDYLLEIGLTEDEVEILYTNLCGEYAPIPTEPSVEPTEPSVEPTEPSVEPTEPSVEPTEPPVEPTEPAEPIDYADVAGTAWYKDAVDYASVNGLMNGMGNNKFEPETVMTRAMLVTILWRHAGSPEDGKNTFTDVKNGEWYTKAIAWAAKNGIVNGMGNNKFEPMEELTREQLATILFRYAKLVGIDTSKRADFSKFADGKKVSAWAKEAMQWAVAEGVIAGSADNGKLYLLPTEGATRAQGAMMLMRYLENVIK